MKVIRKAVFYGDSNTYGFDPRNYFGGCYEAERIWTSRAAAALGEKWKIINEGMNGRCLPAGENGFRYIERILSGLTSGDLFVTMLGTNDLLLSADANVPAGRMEKYLKRLRSREFCPKLLILAPPYVGSETNRDAQMALYYRESVRMNEAFRRLAEEYQVWFADAAEWDIDLAFDQVHFSEEGHQTFSEHVTELLREL